ncbi:MAG: RNA polymerase sigma factor [Deltaproteobacteria bacterium]|nr:RNA polymerase sigma factor [Deltaproteobacteria bacterium]
MHDSDELFDTLFRENRCAVLHYFRNLGCALEECEDLTQETFFRVYRSINSLDQVKAQRPWIFTVAVNVWRNRLREGSAKKRAALLSSLEEVGGDRQEVVSVAEQVGSSSPPAPLDFALAEERKEQLRDALTRLPVRMRRTVRFRVDQDLKYQEIAELMNVSIDTVKTQLFQARRRLKEELGSYFERIEI